MLPGSLVVILRDVCMLVVFVGMPCMDVLGFVSIY